MAIVNLKQVEVSRVNSRGHGVQVVEKWESKGKSGQTRFTVWFDSEHGLSVGDRIDVSGFLGAKVGEPWTDRDGNQRTSVELSLNSPRIGKADNAPSGSVQAPAATADTWGTPALNDSEVPF